MKTQARTFDEYLAALGAEQRAALEQLRATIRKLVPQAEECISYGLAAFRHEGRSLVAMGATAKHCAFYLMSGSTVEAHRKDLAGYDLSKGTIRFQPDQPLPAALVRKLVKARLRENEALDKATGKTKSTHHAERGATMWHHAPRGEERGAPRSPR